MPFKVDYLDGDVVEWTLTEDGVTHERTQSYTPTLYVSVHGGKDLPEVYATLREHPNVTHARRVEERVSFRHDPSPVLRVDVDSLDAVTTLAHEIAGWGAPGDYRLYNVDFSREFRYCLEQGISPTPARKPTVLELTVDEEVLASEQPTEVVVDDEPLTGDPETVLTDLDRIVDAEDPDVLMLNTSEVVPVLYRAADRLDLDEFQLGRLPGWQQLAGDSTYASYGQVGHSPARYNLPGRAIIDRSNTFFWSQSNLDGCLYLIEQSGKPLQELAWASIGNILTAIQIREARRRGVLVPWHSWRHEQFKTMRQLHEADRGGFTFAPDVGVHEDVHELDFSSLYPNIIVTRNVSPEKIRCDCHAGRDDVPGLGYCICDERGYLPAVLGPLIADRDAIKQELCETNDPERAAELEGQSSAIKWILVSCFGYQGFSNAKFGRIECHEAINAFAREILLDTKQTLEAHGWRVVHGIVDSVWVTPEAGEEQTPLDELAATVTEAVDIRLEHEAHYDWVAFVPMRNSEAGALTKYFGKVDGDDDYKFRGIECRQRSTPQFIEDAQKDLIAALDEHRDIKGVCERLKRWIQKIQTGEVDVEDLVVKNRVSKPLDDYTQSTRNVAALERVENRGLTRSPGQDVEYVVVDDSKQSSDRVALASEGLDEYDVDFYRAQLLRAAESVLSPLGWREGDVEQYLADHKDVSLQAF
ncbi:DNA polymerase I [Halogranum gelatinilyticum]|uniref:DNA-directed DNA polymerase n=1 Tax=Halogranum gelatinilyticum TaxID=660521 RepID=A0A1G9XRA2_9EURY|nr:type B DNA-directed DNA polymerase [Halogranum gelatinilyticum]SDM99041.1 DNA polymerase I [Halogranum gelatinilyticum]